METGEALHHHVGMMNYLHAIGRRLPALIGRSRRPRRTPSPPWPTDPLSHPHVQRMALHQLADLPFERYRTCDRTPRD